MIDIVCLKVIYVVFAVIHQFLKEQSALTSLSINCTNVVVENATAIQLLYPWLVKQILYNYILQYLNHKYIDTINKHMNKNVLYFCVRKDGKMFRHHSVMFST